MTDLILKHEIEHNNSGRYLLSVTLVDSDDDPVTSPTTVKIWKENPDDNEVQTLLSAIQDGCRLYAEYVNGIVNDLPDVAMER